MAVDHDLIGGQGNQGPSAHRVMRHDCDHPAIVVRKRLSDLARREHEPPGVCEDDLDRPTGSCARIALSTLSESSMSICRMIGSRGTTSSRRWISVITVASRLCEMDASILLRAVIARTCRCTTGCRELRMKKIQIRFRDPRRQQLSVVPRVDTQAWAPLQ